MSNDTVLDFDNSMATVASGETKTRSKLLEEPSGKNKEMKVWLAYGNGLNSVAVYDSYQTLKKDLDNLHSFYVDTLTEEGEEWVAVSIIEKPVDKWIEQGDNSEGWWFWETEYLWRNTNGNKTPIVTRFMIEVKIVIQDSDFED